MVFLAAIREKSQCWVALSCDVHLVSAGLGRIRQPCFQSLSEWNLVRTFFKHSPFCAGNYDSASCGGIDAIVMRAACDEASATGFAAADAMHSIAMQKMQKEAREHEHANAQLLATLDDYRQAARQHEQERTHQKLLLHDLVHKQNVQAQARLPVPAAADPFALLTREIMLFIGKPKGSSMMISKALRQFSSGNAVKITEFNNVSATVSVESSGNYTCNIMSFNFKRHNNTYEFLQRHNYFLQNCMTFLCHKF